MQIVKSEIVALHEFFVGWFSGTIPESAFEQDFSVRFDPEFILIPPAGTLLKLEDLSARVRNAYASNPDFKIAIRNVKVRRVLSGNILATYEEWQKDALASKPANNARLASVLFKDSKPLKWLHVHETWMLQRDNENNRYEF